MDVLQFLSQILNMSMLQLVSFIGLMATGAVVSKLNLNTKDNDGMANINDLECLLKSDGAQLSKNIFLSTKALYEHLVILGPTGAGKSSAIFIPNLLQKESFNNSESSIVITDPKGEMHSITSDFQRKIGRRVKVFAPYQENISIHYNPIDFCETKSDVIALAKDILVTGAKAIEIRNGGSSNKDSVWINMATPLFSAALLYVYSLKKPHNTISNALKLIIKKEEDELRELLLSQNDEDIELQYKMYEKCTTSPATSGSIQITLAANVQSFLTPAIERITAYTDFSFKELRENKIALYLIYPVEKSSDLAPLTSIFFNQLFNICKDYNKDNHYPLFCLFDEFSNIGAIPNFNTHASTLRSYRIGLICCLQDKNQLKSLYGNHAETIFNNLKNLALFGGEKDFETLRAITALCGKNEILNISTTNNHKGDTSITKSYKTKDVFAIDELKNISENEIFIMLKNQKPILDSINSYYKDYKYLNNTI